MPQIDLGDGLYYKRGYGIYCLDLNQKVTRLVISEEKLVALDKWLNLLKRLGGEKDETN